MDSEIGHFIVAQNNAKQKTGGVIEVIRAVQSMQTSIYIPDIWPYCVRIINISYRIIHMYLYKAMCMHDMYVHI